MEIKMTKVERAVTEEELQKAEKKIGAAFPPEYKKFLLKHNGGHPEPCAAKFKCEGKDWQLAAVARFLAIGDEIKHVNFLEYVGTYEGRIPPETIPIAHDPGGSLFLLCVTGERKGKVYFWLQDFEPESLDESCFVANSFDEFFDSLFDPDA